MLINNVLFNVELSEILNELIAQMRINHIDYMQRTKETTTHIQVCCPYHNSGQERRPSAGIRKSDGKFHCFACNEVHELPEVISHCLGHGDDVLGKFGWSWLLKNFSNMQVEEREDVKIDFSRNSIDSSIRDKYYTGRDTVSGVCRLGGERYVSEEELEKYRYTHPYMYERKLTDDIIELFDIGYDKATQCITFPVRDIQGNCLFVARRSVKGKFFNYPKDVEKPLYGLYELDRYGMCYTVNGRGAAKRGPLFEEVIVTESMLDALTCWVYGKYAVALNGVGSELQIKQLKQLPCRKLILATDNDKAGQKAREKLRSQINNKIITEYILPDNRKDINELSEEEFEQLEEVF